VTLFPMMSGAQFTRSQSTRLSGQCWSHTTCHLQPKPKNSSWV